MDGRHCHVSLVSISFCFDWVEVLRMRCFKKAKFEKPYSFPLGIWNEILWFLNDNVQMYNLAHFLLKITPFFALIYRPLLPVRKHRSDAKMSGHPFQPAASWQNEVRGQAHCADRRMIHDELSLLFLLSADWSMRLCCFFPFVKNRTAFIAFSVQTPFIEFIVLAAELVPLGGDAMPIG